MPLPQPPHGHSSRDCAEICTPWHVTSPNTKTHSTVPCSRYHGCSRRCSARPDPGGHSTGALLRRGALLP